VTFPGGKKVNAELGGMVIPTDQPVESGGEGTAPSPYDYFLASIGTCAGFYVLAFCQQRGIATENISLRQAMEFTPTADGRKKLSRVQMEIVV
ncbi:OsmC family protein, partial [Klebsiella pneumoniae]|nr:OsmC family protein [Klebsiella pneumoniae]